MSLQINIAAPYIRMEDCKEAFSLKLSVQVSLQYVSCTLHTYKKSVQFSERMESNKMFW
ncbi:hypothetical protein PSKAS_07760 [Peribacillus sp. N1]